MKVIKRIGQILLVIAGLIALLIGLALTRCWRTAVKAVGFDPKPTVHDLRHCWFTNAVRSKVYPYIADAILVHGDKKKSLQSLYLTISDDDLIKAIDMMKFDVGETDIRTKK